MGDTMTGMTADSAISADGTTIGYRTLGHGPGLVIVHGAMESALSHAQLAEALANDFTVHLVDRRGRGGSGPFRVGHGLRTEVEDLAAVLGRTGAHDLLGVSSGAIVCLHVALTLPDVRRAAIFEPPLRVGDSVSTAWLPRHEKELAKGRIAAALVTGMRGTRMGPPFFDHVPRPLLELLTTLAMAFEARRLPDGHVPMRALAATLRHDVRLVDEASDTLEAFRSIPAEVLLLGGQKSPAYLHTALDALEKVLPHAERVEFPAAGHGMTGNTNQGGRPAQVATRLRHFFAAPPR
jgi:pimeloyl-ACP methyl ester carboxylesterase